MSTFEQLANDVLAHSKADGEWDDRPEQIESRPSGTQVVSARLPAALAESLLAEAGRRGVKPSELVRVAVERLLGLPTGVVVVSASASRGVRVVTPVSLFATENQNLVVEVPMEPPVAAALGFSVAA